MHCAYSIIMTVTVKHGNIVHITRFARRQSSSPPIPLWQKVVFLLSGVTLIGTTIYWARTTALLHMTNADQLVNTYLARHVSESTFPAAHTFLMKLPIFMANHWLGASTQSFVTMTVILTLITVIGLGYGICRIESRSPVRASLLMALTSILLYVPMQVSDGVPLPVNMAMMTTRNIEYLLFIAALYGTFRAAKYRSWWILAAWIFMTVLFVSDRLFVAMSVGGAVCAVVMGLLSRRRRLVTASLRWMSVSVGALVGSVGIIYALNALKVTQIISAGFSPYQPVFSLKGLAYSFVSIVTNFGANPLYDTTIHQWSWQLFASRIATFAGLGYGVNMLLFVVIAALVVRFIWKCAHRSYRLTPGRLTAIALLYATVATVVAFACTNHTYYLDARYLGISLFAGMIAATYGLRDIRFLASQRAAYVCVTMGILCVAAASGVAAVQSHYAAAKKVDSTLTSRNEFIASALRQLNTTTLVADYWRAVPIYGQTQRQDMRIVPLSNCLHTKGVLTDTRNADWQKDSFAYLYTFGKTNTDFPSCDPEEVIQAYGLPSRVVVVDGSAENPKEMLLFYDKGVDKESLKEMDAAASAADGAGYVPSPFEQLPPEEAMCSGRTILTVVAHEDDDILFMSPDLQRAGDTGDCLRTVFVTAGDADQEKAYWLSRQLGAEAAYSKLLGLKNQWTERRIKVGDGRFVTAATPNGSNRATLFFLQLPDGNITGKGFTRTKLQSLAKLYAGEIQKMDSVDGLSSFTSDGLRETLFEIMNYYAPDEVRTHATNSDVAASKDHSDHKTVGMYTRDVHKKFAATIPETLIHHYVGYPATKRPRNVEGKDFERKYEVFMNYAQHDRAVCKTTQECDAKTLYGEMVRRQYKE
jgi:LmbE family N-acetylglucosaminyl deacetylase